MSKTKLGDALQRKRVDQATAEEPRSALEGGLSLRGQRRFVASVRDEPNARGGTVSTELDTTHRRAGEAGITHLPIEERIQFFAKEPFEASTAQADVRSSAPPRPLTGHRKHPNPARERRAGPKGAEKRGVEALAGDHGDDRTMGVRTLLHRHHLLSARGGKRDDERSPIPSSELSDRQDESNSDPSTVAASRAAFARAVSARANRA